MKKKIARLLLLCSLSTLLIYSKFIFTEIPLGACSFMSFIGDVVFSLYILFFHGFADDDFSVKAYTITCPVVFIAIVPISWMYYGFDIAFPLSFSLFVLFCVALMYEVTNCKYLNICGYPEPFFVNIFAGFIWAGSFGLSIVAIDCLAKCSID